MVGRLMVVYQFLNVFGGCIVRTLVFEGKEPVVNWPMKHTENGNDVVIFLSSGYNPYRGVSNSLQSL